MSNRILVFILAILVIGGFVFFFGSGNNTAEAPVVETPTTAETDSRGTHTMPDGAIMHDTDPTMEGMHMMPDGTMMAN